MGTNKRTNRNAVCATAMAIVLLLPACLYFRMGDTWHLSVRANPHAAEIPNTDFPCQGAISATVDLGRVGTITASARPSEQGASAVLRHAGTVLAGQAVSVEAICTDELGAEIGFVRIEGHVLRPGHDSGAASTSVRPGLTAGDDRSYCLTASTSRGVAPCVWSRDIEPAGG